MDSRSEEKVVARRSRYVVEGGHDYDCGGSPQQRQRRDISGPRSKTPMTDLSVIAGSRRLRRGGVIGGSTSGEAAVNGGKCGGVHQRWLKETKIETQKKFVLFSPFCNKFERNKRRVVSCPEEDRISKLPEQLIDSILELLPIEDSVRTSIISESWRYRWTTMGALVFDKHFSNKFANNGAFGRNGFIRIINQVLFLHKGPILKFHLHIPNISLDSFQEVDQWMSFLSRNGVTELLLTNLNQRYELPSYVFSCLELTKLKLVNCFFKTPLKFEGCLNLEELCLQDVDFGTSLCGNKINLPQLKKLILLTCKNVYNFNIKATKLCVLTIVACRDTILLRLLDSSCLFVAGLALRKPIQDFVRGEKINLATMLSKLPRVEYLFIDNYFLKSLVAEKIPKFLPRAISSLKRLWLFDYQLGDMDQLHVALCFLRNSLNLEKLSVTHSEMESRVDVGPASNHLESPNCLDCMLTRLQTVKIECLQGSKPELLFIKLLLAHSPSLQNFTITPSENTDAQKRFDIAKDVMQFRRASPKAKMIYLNPET
ncbi:unnamed protein product [Lactuca virosa]|uniref:F-box domain-containing protein n=1 Tax=Lactuca virosa TaxID=75947 RepID=A0AAU9NU65_9ASTR|nr:unnamed protein product [Lactuca virosa]